MLLGIPLQTAYVTTDIDRACDLLGEKYGVTQFLRQGTLTIHNDAGEAMVLGLAHAWIGSTWLEIIQPVAGAVEVYSDWLPKEGFGLRFHHVGIRLADLETWDRTMAEARAGGQRIVFSITKGAPSRVFYIDTAAELGHYVEYLYFPDAANSTMAKMPQNIPGFQVVY